MPVIPRPRRPRGKPSTEADLAFILRVFDHIAGRPTDAPDHSWPPLLLERLRGAITVYGTDALVSALNRAAVPGRMPAWKRVQFHLRAGGAAK